jgi:hypothetical protein
MAAISVLALHLAIIVFNVAGCVLIPVGAWRGWQWVREFWWRLAHLFSLAAVAAQALSGHACFLTIWQGDLSGAPHVQPLIAAWIDRLIHWPLPLWMFAIAYAAIFVYVIVLWIAVLPLAPWQRRAATKRDDHRSRALH